MTSIVDTIRLHREIKNFPVEEQENTALVTVSESFLSQLFGEIRAQQSEIQCLREEILMQNADHNAKIAALEAAATSQDAKIAALEMAVAGQDHKITIIGTANHNSHKETNPKRIVV